MSEVKIGVTAGVQGVDTAIQRITSSMNKLGAAVAKNAGLKFEPTDIKTMERDLALINKQFAQTLALSSQLRSAMKATGQTGAHISQVDFSKLSANPQVAQRMRDRAFLNSVRGTSLDPTLANEVDHNGNIVPPGAGGGAGASGGGSGGSGGGGGNRRPPRGGGGAHGGADEGGEGSGGSWWKRRPNGGFGTATALAIGNGIGGTAGDLVTAAAGGGGFAGVGLTALTAIIGKAVSFASEGMDLAKQQNQTADVLKRSMGDLGVSFKELTDDSRSFGQQIGVAGGEFLKLEEQANSASGGLYRTPKELAAATLSGGDLARAYGLQPSQGVNFVAGMDRLNNRQNNKELATALAEAIVNTQGKATAGEVMQAMQGFAAAQNRFNSGTTDLNQFGNAYSTLLGSDGMTADHASDILGTANAAMQRMGGTEASRNFTMQAFGMDPIRSAMRAEGGLFSNGLDNRDIGGYMRAHGAANWEDQSRGPSGTNYDVIKGAFDSAYGGRGQYGAEMELDAEKNYFGLRSYSDTASFMKMSDGDHNGINMLLGRAGVKLSDLNEGSLQSISALSKVGSVGDVDALYRNGPDAIRNRSDMSDDDKNRLDAAESAAQKSGNAEGFVNELVRTLSGKGQADDDATTQRSIDANLENIKTQIGERLVPLSQTGTQALIWVANKLGAGISMPTDPTFVGPQKPDAAASPSLPAAIAASKVSKSGDGLHTATGGTVWDSAVDGAISGFNWLKSQGQDGSAPLGIRSNNPLNMLTKGKENVYSDPTQGIAEATANLEHGYRGLTLAQITDKWTGGLRVKGSTPESLNNYTNILSRATGLKADAKPNLDDPKVVSVLMAAMIKAENGKMPYSDDQINAGVGAGMGGHSLSMEGFKPDMSIIPEPTPKGFKPDMSIVEEPRATIPENHRVAASSAAASKVGAGAGNAMLYGTGGDININLHQTVTTPGGATKTKMMSAKVANPTAAGSRNQTIQVPG